MSKEGKHSIAAAHHGREGWKRWKADNAKLLEKGQVIVHIPVSLQALPNDTSLEENLISAPDHFKSFISSLRADPGSKWGYLVVKRVPENADLVSSGLQSNELRKQDKDGRILVISGVLERELKQGVPDIDAGAKALIGLDEDHSGWPARKLNEIHDPYSRVLNESGKILETYDYIRKGMVPFKESRKPQAEGAVDNLRRKTIDVSPGISRAIQLMIEAGRVTEAQEILGNLQLELALEVEKIFPNGKVVACAWHCNSGMPEKPGILHLDLWMHSTKLEIVHLGKKNTPTLLRTWDPKGLNHCGPGPGICAWDRHVDALGKELEALAPNIVYQVTKAINFNENRAIESDRAGSANRDIRLHRKFDELLKRDLPHEFVDRGMSQYREHLRTLYRDGGMSLAKVISDPEKFEKRKATLENSMREIIRREDDLEKRLSLQIAEGAPLVAERLRRDEGRRLVEQKQKSKELGQEIATLLAHAKESEWASDQMLFQAEDIEYRAGEMRKWLEVEMENLHLQAENLEQEVEYQRRELEKERQEACVRGLNDARRAILGESITNLTSGTKEQIGKVFQKEISDKIEANVFEKLDGARKKLAGDQELPLVIRSVDAVEKEIANEIVKKIDASIIAGLKNALRTLNPNVRPSADTQKGLLEEITTSIANTVVQKLSGVLKWLRPEFSSASTAIGDLDTEIEAGQKEWEKKARESGLEEARKALLGQDASELFNPSEEVLRESLKEAAHKLKSTAKLEAAAEIMGEAFDKTVEQEKDPVVVVNSEFKRLRQVESMAKIIAAEAPAKVTDTRLGQALSKLREILKIKGPDDGKGGYEG